MSVSCAAEILNMDEVCIIGSQALHGSLPGEELPGCRSKDVDILLEGPEARAMRNLLNDALGRASAFRSHYGYYADGLVLKTPILPDGWEARLVPYPVSGLGTTALCLNAEDLWLSKAFAGREKDWEFCLEVANLAFLDDAALYARLRAMRDITPLERQRADIWMRSLVDVDREHSLTGSLTL